MSSTYIFSDIDMSLNLNIKGDIAKKLDVNSIRQAVKNIVLTPKKPFQPNFGPRISYALFDMDNPFERALLKDEIEVALKKHDKRIHSIKVEFSESIDANEMVANISFQIVNVVGRYDVDVVLQKVR